MSGLAFAAAEGEMLDLVLFIAPREHYFEQRREEIEALFASLRRR